MLRTAGFALLFAFAGGCAFGDSVLYSTGFEPPAFTTGPIAGQDGWSSFGPGTPTVEDFFAYSGSQAVFVNGGTNQSGPLYTLSSPSASGPLIDMSAELAIFTSSNQTGWQFGATGPGGIGFLGGIDIDPSTSQIYAITHGFPTIGTFNRATDFNGTAWQNVNLLFDLATQTYNITINGVQLATNVPFCDGNSGCSTTGPAVTTFGDAIFDSLGTKSFYGGNDSGYMDNFSLTLVTPTPEPSTAWLLLGGLALLSFRAKFRRSA